MRQVSLRAVGLSKTFNRRNIFKEISFSLNSGDSLAVTGRNGSGKSTLLKILASLLSPTSGEHIIDVDGIRIKSSDHFSYLGFVSPYLQLYDEFTGWENLDIFWKARGIRILKDDLDDLLRRVGLWERRDDYVRTYSSGMKQRLKYASALLHKPPILLLDEPLSNLDSSGVSSVKTVMEEQNKSGILIIATNDADDLRMCDRIINLDGQRAERPT